MPFLGLGTSHNGGYSHDAVVVSLRHGLRAIDTATRYGCESQIADAIAASGVRRADVFITTKLFYDDYGYDNAIRSAEASLARLRTDYIDLYLLHWPGTPSTTHNRQIRADTWRALVHLYSVGKVRSIGVSNFLQSHLEQLQADSLASGISERPHVNQVECHCFNHPVQLIAYCRQHGIAFEGYCPLAKGQLLIEPTIVDMAKLYACTPAQLCIRWNLQHGYICIPKSTKPERVVENACVFFFSITPGDMTKLDALHDGRHVTWDPTNVP
ncbi:hypothetical protein DYB37_007872 [Aphanomyces astaci]|uniref:NADP-dependent oxidoreductase domain-containing protein n=1 Tax=Aphanomyces astaci TaxID=112090 RepID=A0A3R7FA94_APHAT|nr:hypothetical protein DYB35_010577 [Aphanomyces astaci]RHZ28722.1 hypothetical protein DYB37_007872 [Aphanomyces astaci]